MEQNIYIKAMEIGYKYNEGIFYSQMKIFLERDLNFSFTKRREYTFVSWFLKNFQSVDSEDALPDTLYKLKYYILHGSKHNEAAYAEIMAQKFYMKGETVKQYIDYLELKESREQAKIAQESSNKAIKIAYISLTISAILAIASIILSLYFGATAPSPPFDVNVLEKPAPVKEKVQIYSDAIKSVEPDNDKD